MESITLQNDVPLAPRTTLEVGGPARVLARCGDPAGLRRAIEVAHDQGLDLRILGGGSNLLVSDRGFDGLVVEYIDDHLSADIGRGTLRVGGGHDWDALVAWSVAHGLAGLECLSGIPGKCGAAPIQNIGAYGEEVASVLTAVHALDLEGGREVELSADDCAFGYRDSRFKRDWRDRYCITKLEFALSPGGESHLRYAELARRVGCERTQDLARVRSTVLAIRREKSMVLDDPQDPNRRSAGSFFTNPVVDTALAAEIASRATAEMPQWEAGPARVKLAAAWLIEQAGFPKGYTMGAVGLSDRHVLALINRGGARAAEIVDIARAVRDRVHERFGVTLVPEPSPLGFEPDEIRDLWPPSAY